MLKTSARVDKPSINFELQFSRIITVELTHLLFSGSPAIVESNSPPFRSHFDLAWRVLRLKKKVGVIACRREIVNAISREVLAGDGEDENRD